MLLYNCPKGTRAITRKGERRANGRNDTGRTKANGD